MSRKISRKRSTRTQLKKTDKHGLSAPSNPAETDSAIELVFQKREMKIVYESSVPTTFRKIIKPRIEAVQDFFPLWCDKLILSYDKDKDKTQETVMECVPKHEYRCMGITIFPLFLEDSEGWYNSALHEIMHGLFRPYTAKTERVIEKFVKDEAVVEYLHEELAEAEECVAEDMAIFAERLAAHWFERGKKKS